MERKGRHKPREEDSKDIREHGRDRRDEDDYGDDIYEDHECDDDEYDDLLDVNPHRERRDSGVRQH